LTAEPDIDRELPTWLALQLVALLRDQGYTPCCLCKNTASAQP
jgi:hypothetical protein